MFVLNKYNLLILLQIDFMCSSPAIHLGKTTDMDTDMDMDMESSAIVTTGCYWYSYCHAH